MTDLSRWQTPAVAHDYARDGVVVLRDLIDTAWRARLERVIEQDLAQPGAHFHNFRSASGRFHATSRLRESYVDMEEYIFNSPLPAMAAYLMGSKRVNLLYDQIFVKEPGTDAASPWHQDHGVWPIRGSKVISFWLALDPVSPDSGGLNWLLGSHRWGRLFQPTTMGGRIYEPQPGFEPMPDVDANIQEYKIGSWNLNPGDVLAFHSLTVHGAKGNFTSERRRRACSIRFVGDDVVYDPRAQTMSELANPKLKAGDALDSEMFPVVWSDTP
jgi:ectoine hydroxylase-related dioxygenase (phytanoyl-CoA dioxygenase family)